MPSARIGDLDIHYELAGPPARGSHGSGPRVLFISGTGSDLRTKPNVFDGPLAKEFEVLGFDQRGLGQSSKPDRTSTMAEYGADAAGLLDHLGWSEVAVVGASFGGMVAQELAIARPDLVRRLVLCCTSSGGAGRSSYPLHELHDLDADERRRRQLAINDDRYGPGWQEANPDEVERAMERMRAADALAPPQDEAGTIGARRQLEARKGHDTWDRLAAITSPTLVAAGRYDGIAPLANSEALASRIPDAELQVFDGGHLFLLQDRTAWPAIVEFLKRDGA
jgi:3-oxoadipate enol-lactonase